MMGPCGSGKSTLGLALANRLGWPYLEGDDLHPPQNVALMAAGTALTDRERAPWLDAISARMEELLQRQESAVVSCSALARRYRARLADARGRVLFVYLVVPEAELRARMTNRSSHFMPASLVDSQLATIEPPQSDENALILDGTLPPEQLLEMLVAKIRARVVPSPATRT